MAVKFNMSVLAEICKDTIRDVRHYVHRRNVFYKQYTPNMLGTKIKRR